MLPRSRDVHHATDDNGRPLQVADRAVFLDMKHPGATELLDVAAVNLIEGGVALVGVAAADHWKVTTWWAVPVRVWASGRTGQYDSDKTQKCADQPCRYHVMPSPVGCRWHTLLSVCPRA